jgi:hypothetical protein
VALVVGARVVLATAVVAAAWPVVLLPPPQAASVRTAAAKSSQRRVVTATSPGRNLFAQSVASRRAGVQNADGVAVIVLQLVRFCPSGPSSVAD